MTVEALTIKALDCQLFQTAHSQAKSHFINQIGFCENHSSLIHVSFTVWVWALTEKAIEAVRQWKFNPGYKDGKPVTVAPTIEVNFLLL
jgi:hypothetical protein